MNQSPARNESAFDVDFARAAFAGAGGPDGRSVFLDNAGGSLVLERVAAGVADYMRRCPVQLGASYAASEEAARRVRSAREALALLVGGGVTGTVQPEEIVLGPSSTELFRRLAEAKRASLAPGDEIVVTEADHESNITPWLRLARQGIVVRTWPVNRESLDLEPDDLEKLIGPRTRLVCFTQATNITGTLTRAREAVRIAHDHGAEVCLDGVAAVPHRLTEVLELGADYYVLSLYKCFGPHLALMYGKRERLESLAGINHLEGGAAKLPWKLEPGAFAYELAWGARHVTCYLAELGARHGSAAGTAARLARAFDAITAHETRLAGRLLDYLRGNPRVTVIGNREAGGQRLPIVSFVARGREPAGIVAAVDRHGIGIRHGHFNSVRLMRALGLGATGVVRVSLAHYNTEGEIGRLIEVLDSAL